MDNDRDVSVLGTTGDLRLEGGGTEARTAGSLRQRIAYILEPYAFDAEVSRAEDADYYVRIMGRRLYGFRKADEIIAILEAERSPVVTLPE